jgi:lipopolysaccharide biosynthesis glycosyltransferase
VNLIYTVSSGDIHGLYSKLTVPLMEEYAKKCKADFRYDTVSVEYPLFAKYHVGELLESYERVLYLDCDILVRPDSPNLFEIVPEACYAAFNEGSWCLENEINTRAKEVRDIAAVFQCKVEGFNLYRDYYNGGVFLANASHKGLFKIDHTDPAMQRITAEQNLLNLRLFSDKVKIYCLPICFNAMPWRWPVQYLWENYFIHYAGMEPEKRYAIMSEDYLKLTGA